MTVLFLINFASDGTPSWMREVICHLPWSDSLNCLTALSFSASADQAWGPAPARARRADARSTCLDMSILQGRGATCRMITRLHRLLQAHGLLLSNKSLQTTGAPSPLPVECWLLGRPRHL